MCELLGEANANAEEQARERIATLQELRHADRLATVGTLSAAGLTEAECHELIALIREIREAGTTIIWIEHVLHALLAVVDRVLVLDFGKVIAEGAPDAIMKDPEVAAVYLGPDAEELETANG